MYRLLTLLNTPRYSRTLVLVSVFHAFSNLSHPSSWQLSLFTAKRHGWVNISDFLFYQLMSRFLKCFSIALTQLPCKLLGRCPKWSISSQSYLTGMRMTWVSKTSPFPLPWPPSAAPGRPHTPPHTLRASTENMEIAVWHVLSYLWQTPYFSLMVRTIRKEGGGHTH